MYFGTPAKNLNQVYGEENIQNKSNSAISLEAVRVLT